MILAVSSSSSDRARRPATASAQEAYPSRPISIVAPFPRGAWPT